MPAFGSGLMLRDAAIRKTSTPTLIDILGVTWMHAMASATPAVRPVPPLQACPTRHAPWNK